MLNSIPGPAYRIEPPPRLMIRGWNPADAPLLKAAIEESLDHLQAWTPLVGLSWRLGAYQ